MSEPAPTKLSKPLIVSLIVNLILLASVGVVLAQHNALRTQMNELTTSYQFLHNELNMTQSKLVYYKTQAEYYSNLARSGNATSGFTGRSTINIVAVRTVQTGYQTAYEGVVMIATVELKIGEGRILVDTQPKIGIDIQTSARTAALVTENLTEVSLSKTDIILTVRAGEDVDVVDGPSAGAAITVAMIAAVRGKSVNTTVYMTGTINSDLTVGQVGGVAEKGLAAAENGASYFLVPKGQSTLTVLVPREVRFGPFVIVEYDRKTIVLQDYLVQQGYSTKVSEVGTVEEAYRQFTA